MSSLANKPDLPVRSKSLSKSEIIKGFSAYRDLFKSSKNKVNGNIKVYYKFVKPGSSGNIQSSPVSLYPQVGFLVSKKIFSKSVTRNKIRRQLRESYREVKGDLNEQYNPCCFLKLIFSLSGKGNDFVKLNNKLNYKQVKSDMTVILDKIFMETKSYF